MSETTYTLNGKKVSRAEFMKDKVGIGGGAPSTAAPWGNVADAGALTILPSQLKEYQEHCRQNNLDVEFVNRGRYYAPKWPERGHVRTTRNRYLKSLGYYDCQAGYSDATRD